MEELDKDGGRPPGTGPGSKAESRLFKFYQLSVQGTLQNTVGGSNYNYE